MNGENVLYLVEEHGLKIWVKGSQLLAPIGLIETFFIQYIEKMEQKQNKPKRARH